MSEGSGAGAPGGPPPFRGSRRVAVRVHPLVSFNKGSSEVGGGRMGTGCLPVGVRGRERWCWWDSRAVPGGDGGGGGRRAEELRCRSECGPSAPS